MAVVSSCCDGVSVFLTLSLQQKCPVKSGNERDLHLQLPAALLEDWAHCKDCPGNTEEGAGNDRSVCPESSGLHARNNGRDKGMQL